MANEVIGTCPCHCCKAVVGVKLSKGGRAYYKCDGNYDQKACGSSVNLGITLTENLRRQFNEQGDQTPTGDKDTGTDAGKPEPKPAGKNDGDWSIF